MCRAAKPPKEWRFSNRRTHYGRRLQTVALVLARFQMFHPRLPSCVFTKRESRLQRCPTCETIHLGRCPRLELKPRPWRSNAWSAKRRSRRTHHGGRLQTAAPWTETSASGRCHDHGGAGGPMACFACSSSFFSKAEAGASGTMRKTPRTRSIVRRGLLSLRNASPCSITARRISSLLV